MQLVDVLMKHTQLILQVSQPLSLAAPASMALVVTETQKKLTPSGVARFTRILSSGMLVYMTKQVLIFRELLLLALARMPIH